jgi:uncharacterized protein (DUF952 family)
MTTIYHIAARGSLMEAQRSGEYRSESLAGEGFIHFSGQHQVLEVANRFYGDRHGLVLLAVDTSRLRAELKYEPPVHPAAAGAPSAAASDQLFPHLYGPLNLDAIVTVYDFEPNAGTFSLPADLIAKNEN